MEKGQQEATPAPAPEGIFEKMRQAVSDGANKPPPPDRQRAEIAARGWQELGYETVIDPETNQVFGVPKTTEPAAPPPATPPAPPEGGKRPQEPANPKLVQSDFLNLVPKEPGRPKEPPLPSEQPAMPLVRDPEEGIDDMHRTHRLRRSKKPFVNARFQKEVRRDTERDWRRLLRAIGALTPGERATRLRTVRDPLARYIMKELGLDELLSQEPMSAEVAGEIMKRLADIDRVRETPAYQQLEKDLKHQFRYWRFLRQLQRKKKSPTQR